MENPMEMLLKMLMEMCRIYLY